MRTLVSPFSRLILENLHCKIPAYSHTMENYKIIISLVILAASLSIGYSALFNCVECESTLVKGCMNDVMNSSAIKNYTRACDNTADNVCMKVVAKATRTGWTGKNGMREVAAIKVSRFCAMMENPKDECKSMDGAAGYLTYCTCRDKACNGGANVVASLLMIASCFLAKIAL
ncbi:uncharacterized protein LOC135493062 [Lineus longissimus]|uniref:uncharacterized protein LOC135493062 n=1 Tax=Lineus longissimus TaxID=88925 RepID=UPI00315DC294